MATITSSAAFPTDANPVPILQLAGDLARLSGGLNRASSQLGEVAAFASEHWIGVAGDAFAQHTRRHEQAVGQGADTIALAVAPLQQFAAAIGSTSNAHASATVVERQAIAAGPDGEGARLAAVGEQQAAVAALRQAGEQCARAVDQVTRRLRANDPDHPTSPARVGLYSPLVGSSEPGTGFGPVPYDEFSARGTNGWATAGDVIGSTKSVTDRGVDGIAGYGTGLGYATDKFGTTVNQRNGNSYTRWKPNVGGSVTELTHAQALKRAQAIERWSNVRIPVLGAAVDGTVQALQDQADPTLTTTQRVSRTTAAVTLQGGGAWAGGAVGAKGGAALGAAVGVWFGGVGAAPGAVVGGVIGGIGGAIAGSEFGGWLKRRIFKSNPGEVFQ